MAAIFAWLDFTMPGAVLAALAIGVLQPVYLLAATRLPGLANRYSRQFLVSWLIAVALWAAALLAIPTLRPSDIGGGVIGLMILICGMLGYLEVWGLLTRGYTLGILRTLLEADQPLREDEVARRYRGGDGLDWLMRHRIDGLIAARLVVRQGPRLALTGFWGLAVARLYRAAVVILGLRRTG
jgi:hypothetical protein